MVLEMKFRSLPEIVALQELAAQADEPVYLSSDDGAVRVDARSFVGLFALDFSKPVQVITDSVYAIRRLEIGLRNQAAAVTQ